MLRTAVTDHSAVWEQEFVFSIEICTDKRNFLKPCPATIKVKKELEGGRSFQLLGIISIDLAEFASPKAITRKYLLQNSKINSTLKVIPHLRQVSIFMKTITGIYDYLCPQPSKSAEKLEDIILSNQKTEKSTSKHDLSPIDPSELLSDEDLNREVIDKLFVK